MRRDDLAKETEATLVTEVDLNYTGTANTSGGLLNTSYQQPQFSDGFQTPDELTGDTGDSNSTSLAGQIFYDTYNPEIGINTATVLGALLLVLVVYVIYRTKCRKRILRAIHKCTMKYFPEEFTPEKSNSPTQTDGQPTAVEAEWISESAKMIWQERAKLSQETDNTKCERANCDAAGSCEVGPHDKRNEGGSDQPIDVDKEVHEPEMLLRLPETEGNVERATAEWVQNVKYLDRKERQLNGIILKIPPDLVSYSAKVRSHFNSVTDYCETEDFVNLSARNKSLPLLIEQQSIGQMNYASMNSVAKTPSVKSNDFAPIATQDDFELGYSQNQLKVQHSSGSKVPLDICPIVKVQHFHSRSKRRLNSINRTSSEDSSNSSDGSCGRQTVPTGVAKYIRLQTDELEYSRNEPAAAFPVNNNVQSNVQNKVTVGKFETPL